MLSRTKLQLVFAGRDNPELIYSIFEHPLLERQRRTCRGRSGGAFDGHGSFNWSRAVKGLTVFFLKAKIKSFQHCSDNLPELLGNGGSLASSLDHALDKQPFWMLDMFGADSNGRSLLKRIINRTNPSRKRVGPVALSLNKKQLEPEHVEVWLDDQALSFDSLVSLHAMLSEDENGILSDPALPHFTEAT